MPLQHFRFLCVLLVTAIAITSIAIFTFNPPQHVQSPETSLSSKVSSVFKAIPASFSKPKAPPKYAFVAFLEDFSGFGANEEEDGGEDDFEEDAYYTATRVLGYQLMHAPRTRSTLPFIVVCANVSPRKRARLEKDGAQIIEVDPIPDPAWLSTSTHYAGVMTKLRVFQLAGHGYEKLLFIDSDMLVVEPLDGIFADAATAITPLAENHTVIPGEAPLPSSYLLSAQAQATARHHPYPPPPSASWFCSGFFVFTPSNTTLTYYLSLLTSPGKFDPAYPDQNLLNYAHRWDGPMPWTRFNYTWTTTFPTMREYEAGAKSLHEKYWLEAYRVEEDGQDVLGGMWLRLKRDMEVFYGGREG